MGELTSKRYLLNLYSYELKKLLNILYIVAITRGVTEMQNIVQH